MKLVIRYNSLGIETINLEPGTYEIGRGSENAIHINHPSIRRQHGKLSFINQSWVYEDGETLRIQTLDNTAPIFLSNEIEMATEAYTLSEETREFSSLGGVSRKNRRTFLALLCVGVFFFLTGLGYFLIKNSRRHSDPNQLLADVRSKIVEFEKIKNPQAIDDYKKYGGFRDEDFRENMGFCTGFFVAPNVVLTASHCLWGSDFLDIQTSFELRTFDGKHFKPVRVLGFDPIRDFLFLELEGAESYGHLDFANDFKIGQTVYTLGNAHGQGIAIREGIMANETADLNDPSIKYIRYSAGASPGNSGGPLLDSEGHIVALVFAATGAENYNLGTSCHDLKEGFKKFVANREPQEISVVVKRLFNFNLNTFMQKQMLPFLPDYNEYPEINQLASQVELTFQVPMEFASIGQLVLTEIQEKSSQALAEIEKKMLEDKQVILDWNSFLSAKTPVILPSQFDSSQNSFYQSNGRYFMKVAGFLDSPSRKDFKAYVEQFDKENKFDFQSYGMNIEYAKPESDTGKPQYMPNNPNKNKNSIDELAQGNLYSQLLLGKKLDDEDLMAVFLKNYFGQEGVLSGTYSAFIRPQAYKSFTLHSLERAPQVENVKDGLGRSWKRFMFQLFDQIYLAVYCVSLPEGTQCVARVFPIENADRRQFVEANFRQHILAHFFENPFFWSPTDLLAFLKSPAKEGLSSFRGINFVEQGSVYAVTLEPFGISFEVPKNAQGVRLQNGLFLNQEKQNVWTGFGAEWILAGKDPKVCGFLVEPDGSQSIYVLNYQRDLLKRRKLKEENKKEETPQYWTHAYKTPKGEKVTLVGYCAPLRENPIEIGAFYVDLKKAKPFTGRYKVLK